MQKLLSEAMTVELICRARTDAAILESLRIYIGDGFLVHPHAFREIERHFAANIHEIRWLRPYDIGAPEYRVAAE